MAPKWDADRRIVLHFRSHVPVKCSLLTFTKVIGVVVPSISSNTAFVPSRRSHSSGADRLTASCAIFIANTCVRISNPLFRAASEFSLARKQVLFNLWKWFNACKMISPLINLYPCLVQYWSHFLGWHERVLGWQASRPALPPRHQLLCKSARVCRSD